MNHADSALSDAAHSLAAKLARERRCSKAGELQEKTPGSGGCHHVPSPGRPGSTTLPLGLAGPCTSCSEHPRKGTRVPTALGMCPIPDTPRVMYHQPLAHCMALVSFPPWSCSRKLILVGEGVPPGFTSGPSGRCLIHTRVPVV